MRLASAALLVGAALIAANAAAHVADEGALQVDVSPEGVSGRLDLPLKDLSAVFALDRDLDGVVTWGELKSQRPAIAQYASERLVLTRGGARCALAFGELAIIDRGASPLASLAFTAACAGPPEAGLDVDYRLLFDGDPGYHALLRIRSGSDEARGVLTADRPTYRFRPEGSRWQTAAAFLRAGTRHIFFGYDHMLFLLGLLVSAIFRQTGRRRRPRASLREILRTTLQLVTSFTVAHSVSLSLVALNVVPRLPPALVEAAIAGSIFLVGLNNVLGFVRERGWMMSFAFGLLHGLGFAAGLQELGFSAAGAVVTLVSFNVGIECANLLVIAAALPLACHFRFHAPSRAVLVYGSALVLCTASAGWLVQAITARDFMPF